MEKKIKSFSALTIFIIIIATITALCLTGSKDLSSVKDVKMTKNSVNSISLSWKEVKKADKIYLATDPDREGEAISWHLMKALKLEGKKVYRISFNEITKSAVKASLKNARDIDMDLVDAQQARRVLDRIVGYKISPLLWAKVKRGLSAGRVQSVTLRIIADREAEIDAFIPEEYWSLEAVLKVKGERRPLTAKFYGTEKEKMTIHSKKEMDEILKALENADITAHK